MNHTVWELLAEVAEARTPDIVPPSGLFQRALRAHRRRRWRMGLMAAVLVIAGAGLFVTVPARPPQAASDVGIDDMPARLEEAPR
jgi:hypothetical protein